MLRLPTLSRDRVFCFCHANRDELSIVCPSDQVPSTRNMKMPWTCFKLEGPFPFGLTGIVASFIDPLAANQVPIFAISTFDTDYVLVKEVHGAAARGSCKPRGMNS